MDKKKNYMGEELKEDLDEDFILIRKFKTRNPSRNSNY